MIVNIHQRLLPASPDTLGALLETLASPNDQLWRSDLVEPMVLSDGLKPGSSGGHGPIRYRVDRHEPGRSVRFRFVGAPLAGFHEFRVIAAGPEAATLRHTLIATPRGRGRVMWPVIEPIHSAAAEDTLDQLELEYSGTLARPSAVPTAVRRLAARPRRPYIESVPPPAASMAVAALDRIHAADCIRTPLLAGDPDDPQAWAERVFSAPAGWISALMRVRDSAAAAVGLRTGESVGSGIRFPVLARTEHEILLGVDDRHLDFRVAVAVRDGWVSVTTAVRLKGVDGRVYWSVVQHVHPRVVRAMLAAARSAVE